MGYVFDVLVPAVIILAIAFIWLRTLLSQFLPESWRRPSQPSRAGGTQQRGGPNPRSFSESGGTFRSAPPGRMARQEIASAIPVENLELIESRPRPRREVPASEERPRAADDASVLVHRALGSPQSIRTAFIVKEVIDPPVSMRDTP